VFGATRLDEKTLRNGDFQHCTFANVSFKMVFLQSSSFLNCVFIGCYFRRAQLVDSSFVGCRFIDCNFSYITIKSSRFPYSLFRGCQLPFTELLHSLPPEPNLREALARNLSLESSRLGLSSEACQYRMTEVRAREEHLRAAFLGHSQWYKDHFDALARLQAAAHLMLSLLNRWLWGYGERIWTLFRNLLVLVLLVFPFAFYLVRDGLVKTADGAINIWDLIWFSVENVVPARIESGVRAIALVPRILASVESAFALIVIALFASYIFRWSLRRLEASVIWRFGSTGRMLGAMPMSSATSTSLSYQKPQRTRQ
jgi:hypothetical protein